MKQFIWSAAFAASILAAPFEAQARPQKKTAQAAARSWVKLYASTDKKVYAPGQPIQVRLTAINTAKKGAYLRFTSGQRFDFSVYRQGNNETVYTWSASRMFVQSLGSLWLKPGQSQHYNDVIGDEMGQLKPGKYRLVARLANTPRPIVAAPLAFEIAAQNTIALAARTDKTRYKIGEAVQIDVLAANKSGADKTLKFESGLDCDVTISDERGNMVWNYGANLRFIRALGEVTWQNGETKNYTRIWNGVALPGDNGTSQIKPGRYRVQTVLQSTPQLLAPPLFIEIK